MNFFLSKKLYFGALSVIMRGLFEFPLEERMGGMRAVQREKR